MCLQRLRSGVGGEKVGEGMIWWESERCTEGKEKEIERV